MDIVNNIIKIAKERGVKQSFLNELIGGYRGKITDWKNGKSTPTDEELTMIAQYFNISLNSLKGEQHEIKNEKENTEVGFIKAKAELKKEIEILKNIIEVYKKMSPEKIRNTEIKENLLPGSINKMIEYEPVLSECLVLMAMDSSSDEANLRLVRAILKNRKKVLEKSEDVIKHFENDGKSLPSIKSKLSDDDLEKIKEMATGAIIEQVNEMKEIAKQAAIEQVNNSNDLARKKDVENIEKMLKKIINNTIVEFAENNQPDEKT